MGLSNYDGKTLEKASEILETLHCPFVINQNRYSLFDRTIENNGLKEMALAWVLKDEIITSVLVRASKPVQILNNIKSINNVAFSEEELQIINNICRVL